MNLPAVPSNDYESFVGSDVVDCEARGGVCKVDLVLAVGPEVAEFGYVFFCVMGFCDNENGGVGFKKGLPFIVDTRDILRDDCSVCGGRRLMLGGVDSCF